MICRDGSSLFHVTDMESWHLDDDEEDDIVAQFLVDAANAAELRKHLYGRVAEKVENLLSVYAAENHLKEPD